MRNMNNFLRVRNMKTRNMNIFVRVRNVKNENVKYEIWKISWEWEMWRSGGRIPPDGRCRFSTKLNKFSQMWKLSGKGGNSCSPVENLEKYSQNSGRAGDYNGNTFVHLLYNQHWLSQIVILGQAILDVKHNENSSHFSRGQNHRNVSSW